MDMRITMIGRNKMVYKELLNLIKYMYKHLSRQEKDIVLFKLQDILRQLNVYEYLEG